MKKSKNSRTKKNTRSCSNSARKSARSNNANSSEYDER